MSDGVNEVKYGCEALMGEKVDAPKTCRAERNLGRMVGRVEDVDSAGRNEPLAWPWWVKRQGA